LGLYWQYFQPFKVFTTGNSISYPHHDPNNPFLHFENSIAVVGIAPKYYSVGQY
jgi:hypothetical protein